MLLRRRVLLKTLLILCFAWIAMGQGPSTWIGAQSKEKISKMYVPDDLSLLDDKASRANGPDETAVRDLASAVVDWAVAGQLPELFSRPYKERIVRAEMSYRRGGTPGASESSIVRLIDGLAQKLDAPEYARSDEEEVHQLRITLSYMTPHMVVAVPTVESGDPIVRTLPEVVSPIEAVFVTRFLLKQKQSNEAYQTTPTERSEVRKSVESLGLGQFPLSTTERTMIYYERLMEVSDPNRTQHTVQELAQRIMQERSEQEQNSARTVTRGVLTIRAQSERSEQIDKIFRRAFSMKIKDALALTDSSLELIGVPAPLTKD